MFTNMKLHILNKYFNRVNIVITVLLNLVNIYFEYFYKTCFFTVATVKKTVPLIHVAFIHVQVCFTWKYFACKIKNSYTSWYSFEARNASVVTTLTQVHLKGSSASYAVSALCIDSKLMDSCSTQHSASEWHPIDFKVYSCPYMAFWITL